MKRYTILQDKPDLNKNIVIDLTSTYDDMGLMVPFDGGITLTESFRICYTGTDNNGVELYFSVDESYSQKIDSITIDWGDGTISENKTINNITHYYGKSQKYTISVLLNMKEGNHVLFRNISVPIEDDFQELNSSISIGNDLWVGESGELIDTNRNIEELTFIGIGKSRLHELQRYGSDEYDGIVTGRNKEGVDYVEYTIDELTYRDYSDGLTQITGTALNLKLDSVIDGMLTRNEHFIGLVEDPVIESDVFVDRGKQSVMEKNLRLCEVDNIAEMMTYGNGFFKIKNQ